MSIQIKISKSAGGEAGELKLSSENFSTDYNEALIHQIVTAYQAGERQGTRAQKNRAAVRGGGAKPWRQKGTGRARAGTSSSPIWRGGGRAFPATTQNFSQKVNRKMYRAGIRSILSELNRQGRLILVDNISMEQPKTRELTTMLKGLDATTGALIVLHQNDDNVALSSRNLGSVSVCTSSGIDPVSLISHEKVVMTVDAAKQIDEAMK